MTKDDIQSESISLISTNDRLLLSWATGCGKSYAFIKIQEYLKAKITWIVVAEIAHIKNWEDEYKKHGKEELLKKTKIFCYASLKNNVNDNIDLLCLDEGHHAASEIRLDYLSTIKANKIVLLTATLGVENKYYIEGIYGKFKEFKISLKQAILWGILPKPRIFLIPLTLEKVIRDCIVEESWGKVKDRVTIYCNYGDRWQYLTHKKDTYPNVKLVISCTQYEKNFHLNAQFIYYKNLYMRTRQEFAKVKWMLIGSERKRFLADSKTNKVKPFIKLLKKKRFICFCGSIVQAELLGKKNAIHSKMKDSTPAEVIDNFDKRKINSIFAVGMLQEGQNLSGIEAGVIIQLDGVERPFTQKSGRTLRADEPILLVFYYKDTRDEEYMQNIIKDIDPEYINIVTSAEEIDIL